MDIIDKLLDLYKQATTEQSHYYVASCAKDAITEIVSLRTEIKRLTPRAADVCLCPPLTAYETDGVGSAKICCECGGTRR